jgi:hypothetical protein
MVCFKIPLDGDYQRADDQTCFTVLDKNGSTVELKPIPTLFVPFPQIVQYLTPSHNFYVQPKIITCGSRLLLIAAVKMPLHVHSEETTELDDMSDEELEQAGEV